MKVSVRVQNQFGNDYLNRVIFFLTIQTFFFQCEFCDDINSKDNANEFISRNYNSNTFVIELLRRVYILKLQVNICISTFSYIEEFWETKSELWDK